ncbi:MAG: cytochrome c-type biogenesis protein [Lysobacterales bacterium]
MKLSKFFILVLTLCLAVTVHAQSAPVQEPMVFESQLQEDRFKQLTQELRCLVCQNQNLADSDAQLAHDLRAEVHEMLIAGNSDDEIKQFMVERYGDFVLYRPPVQQNTYLLWLAPMVLLFIGALILRANIKKRSALLESTPDETSENKTE